MNRLNLTKYTQKDRVKRELQDTIKTYNDLVPRMELYAFNDGVQRNLAALCGTIKVYFINQVYNIPICIYLNEAHPYQAPFVFVKPTATMQIKPNKTVDITGRVFLPYLNEWNMNSSDLQSLLSILQIEFGEQMPVFSKSTASATSYPTTNPNQFNHGGYPQYPVQTSHGIGSGWAHSTASPYPVTTTTTTTPHANYKPYYPQATTTINTMNSIDDDVLKMSIMSAVEDKLRRTNKDIFAQLKAELEVLETTNTELKRGSEKIQRMIKEMDEEKMLVQRSKRSLEEDNEGLRSAVFTREKESDEGINYDEVVEASAPLYRQLLHLYVEDQSLDDVFYFLGEALGKTVIDTETFLKKVRELSRRQFMARATVKKCREKAGLPDV